jgi:hypothetical protein
MASVALDSAKNHEVQLEWRSGAGGNLLAAGKPSFVVIPERLSTAMVGSMGMSAKKAPV